MGAQYIPETPADIGAAPALTADQNYVSDAGLVVLGNTSGTNTGDEPAASETVAGIVELATAAEVTTGTDTERAVTPAGLKVELDKKVIGETDSGGFSGTIENVATSVVRMVLQDASGEAIFSSYVNLFPGGHMELGTSSNGADKGSLDISTGVLTFLNLTAVNGLSPSLIGAVATTDSRLTESRADLTPSAGAAGTITLDLSLGRSFKINCVTNSPTSLTIAFSNVPTGTALTAVSLLFITGAGALPSVTWPSGVTAPTLVVSKTAWFTLATSDNGTTTRLFSAGAF